MQYQNLSRYGDRWSSEDDEFLRENWEVKSPQEIAEALGRTVLSVKTRSVSLSMRRVDGYQHPFRKDSWTIEEVEALSDHLEIARSFRYLVSLHNEWREKNGLSPRKSASIRTRVYLQGWSLRKSVGDGEYLTIKAIAAGLRCNPNRVRQIIKNEEAAKILKPERDPNSTRKNPVIWIHRKNLRQLILSRPEVIDGLSPDMVWLIQIIAC